LKELIVKFSSKIGNWLRYKEAFASVEVSFTISFVGLPKIVNRVASVSITPWEMETEFQRIIGLLYVISMLCTTKKV